MEQKVRIATFTDKELSKAPAVVSLITASDIRASGATNLVDVLRFVPGLHVRYQQFGYRPLIGFRGANDKQTLILVDGAPTSDLMWRQGIFWKGLPASAIERVEIIRGPGSALFGTDASAGVINVITKAAGKIEHSEAGMRIGNYDTGAAWIQHGNQWNGFDLAFTAEFSSTNGFDPHIAKDAQSALDDARGTSASLAPGNAQYGWDNTDLRFSIARDRWRLLMDYTQQDNLKTGITGAGAIDTVTEGDSSRFNAALLFEEERPGKNWGVTGELRYRHLDYSSGNGFQEWPPGHRDKSGGLYPDGIFNLMASAENSVLGEISGTYRGISDHQLTLGAGFRWQDIYKVRNLVNSGMDALGNTLPAGGPLVDVSDSPYAFAPEKSRTITYLFLQNVWDISEALELTAGARFDHNSDYGESINPRLALVWRPRDDLTAKFLYGQAFRAPYFQELYTETSFSLPNPDLNPEQSETFEVAISYTQPATPALALTSTAINNPTQSACRACPACRSGSIAMPVSSTFTGLSWRHGGNRWTTLALPAITRSTIRMRKACAPPGHLGNRRTCDSTGPFRRIGTGMSRDTGPGKPSGSLAIHDQTWTVTYSPIPRYATQVSGIGNYRFRSEIYSTAMATRPHQLPSLAIFLSPTARFTSKQDTIWTGC